MKISTKGRYALRIMIDLAQHDEGEAIPLKEISERQGITLKYMEQIMPVLVKNGLVEAVHGKGGGYRLGVKPSECRVGDVLRLTEGDLAPVACLSCGAEPCNRYADCKTIGMWSEFNRITNEYFDGITLSDLNKG